MNERNPFAFLPVPDRYIETAAPEATRLSVIVPVYKEYGNGNIFRLIDTFSDQNVDPNLFELLCVVNNPRQEATELTAAYKENLQTLDLLSGKDLPENASFYQKAVMQKARKYGLNIHGIDATSGGVEKNMGIARQVGVIEAVKRMREIGVLDEGVIAHLDADTVVGKDYVKKLLDVFADGSTSSAFLNYDYVVPHGTEELFETTKRNELLFWCHRLHWLMKGHPIMATPQITATANAHIEVNGVPLRNSGEDIELARNLRGKTSFTIRPDITVYASDRARMESFDGRGRHLSFQKIDHFTSPNPSRKIAQSILESLQYHAPRQIPDIDELVIYMSKCGIDLNRKSLEQIYLDATDPNQFYLQVNNLLYEKERNGEFAPIKPLQYAEKILGILDAWGNDFESQVLTAHILRETKFQKKRFMAKKKVVFAHVKQAFVNGGLAILGEKDPRVGEFLEQNPWVVSTYENLNTNSYDFEELKDKIIQEFPDLLGDWSDDLHGTIAKIKGIYTFIFAAQENPSQFPGTTQLLKHY